MARASFHGSPLLLEEVPLNWHPLRLTALTKKALMESLSHYSNFIYDENKGFVVEVPVGAGRGKVARAPPATLKDHVEVDIKLTRGGHCSTRQPGRPLEKCYSWWLGQLIHYGLPLELSADEAKYRVKTAMLNGELRVPAALKKMEQRYRTAAKRRATKMNVKFARKRSSSRDPRSEVESELDTSDSEGDSGRTQTLTARKTRQVRLKIEDETSSDGDSNAATNDETSKSSGSEPEVIALSPQPISNTKRDKFTATKALLASSAQTKLAFKLPAAEQATSSSESDSDYVSIEADPSPGDFEYERAVLANSEAIEGKNAIYRATDSSSSDNNVKTRSARQAPRWLEIKRDRKIRPEELEDLSADEQIPTPTPTSGRKRKRASSTSAKAVASEKHTPSPGSLRNPFTLSDSEEPITPKREPTPKQRKSSSYGKRVALISDDTHSSQIDLVSPEPEPAAETESSRNNRDSRRKSHKKSSPPSEPTTQPLHIFAVEIPSTTPKSQSARNPNKRVAFPSSPPTGLKGILKSSPDFRPRNSILSQVVKVAAPPSQQPPEDYSSPKLPLQPPMPRSRKIQQNLTLSHRVSSHGYTTKSGFQALNDHPRIRPSGQIEEEAQTEPRRNLFSAPAPAPEVHLLSGLRGRDGGGLLHRRSLKAAAHDYSTTSKTKKRRRQRTEGF